jgi:hypothetical protein
MFQVNEVLQPNAFKWNRINDNHRDACLLVVGGLYCTEGR